MAPHGFCECFLYKEVCFDLQCVFQYSNSICVLYARVVVCQIALPHSTIS